MHAHPFTTKGFLDTTVIMHRSSFNEILMIGGHSLVYYRSLISQDIVKHLSIISLISLREKQIL